MDQNQIQVEFEMINMGLLNHFMSCNFFSIKRHHNSQQGYATNMFKKFKLGIYNVVMVFMVLVFKLTMEMAMLGANLKTLLGCKLFKVYQNLVATSPFFVFFTYSYFYHVKTHLWMIMMESIIIIV
jgi:hypothetical protein